MNTNEFLTTLGWPTAELGDLGSAEWSAPSPGDFSVLSAGIARQSKSIRAWVHQADLEDSKDLLVLEMSVSGDSVAVEKSMVGDPLTESPLEPLAPPTSGPPRCSYQPRQSVNVGHAAY